MYVDQIESPRWTYNSKLREWDRRASVRIQPRRLSEHGYSWSGSYFVAELAPVTLHPLVSRLGQRVVEEILVQNLYTYLDATTIIEAEVVNTVAKDIVQGTLGVYLPEEMVFDACKIYCDEAY